MTRPDIGGSAAPRPAGRSAAVPILAYHDVSPTPNPAFRRYSVTVHEFERQMRWIATRGYQPINMDTLVAARSGQADLPERPVVITFDDGFQGCVDYAVPVLRQHRFTAVFYLVTGLMGSTSVWMARDPGVNLPLMRWDTARSLLAEGFQLGVHTAHHPRLTELEPSRRRVELVEARRQMEDELGCPALHFAYPYGAYDTAVRDDVAEAGYVTACSTQRGLSEPGDDILALHRITVYGERSVADFGWRLRTGQGVGQAVQGALGGWLRYLTGRPRR